MIGTDFRPTVGINRRGKEGLARHKRLSFLGIEIRAVHEGVVNTVLVGLRGFVGQLYREDNARKVCRGQVGRDPSIKALAAQHANLDLDHVQPAGALWHKMELDSAQHPPRFG
jgi:hypothetical protein